MCSKMIDIHNDKDRDILYPAHFAKLVGTDWMESKSFRCCFTDSASPKNNLILLIKHTHQTKVAFHFPHLRTHRSSTTVSQQIAALRLSKPQPRSQRSPVITSESPLSHQGFSKTDRQILSWLVPNLPSPHAASLLGLVGLDIATAASTERSYERTSSSSLAF
ncbi:uncharacterized protein LY89DRAFT_462796 [Mollisia scopiformis]|uniref:Uncharacterized protein n=1 Tax=Mollisia scopiformis TaxID=149040 RepID=A0A194XI84_MOLSC|nr:uncharacterized protein LY89DRAFT_462796 [Mollisia scopiformis]KUJ19839.1 hypothetical protein LY89DRAFT_462796 [Mollisia scopiformis]